MARFKRTFRKRGLKRKRGRFNRKPNRRFTKRVKIAVNSFAEKKASDGNFLFNATNTGTFTVLNSGLPQGTGNFQRVGSQVTQRNLRINLICNNGAGAPIVYWRVVVGVWHDYTSTAPSTTAMFQNPTSQTLTMYNRIPLQQKEWTPMYDRTFQTYNNTTGYQGLPVKVLKLNFRGKRLPNKKATYTSSSIVQDAYFILVFNSFVGVSSYPYAEGDYRITYTDV